MLARDRGARLRPPGCKNATIGTNPAPAAPRRPNPAFPMMNVRIFPTVLLGLLLSACLSPSEPYLLNLDFEGNISMGEDVCLVGLTVQASGTGTADWQGITYQSATGVIHEYRGATLSDYFGTTSIDAGATQVSERVAIPLDAVDPSILIEFTIRGRDRSVTIMPVCQEDEEGEPAT